MTNDERKPRTTTELARERNLLAADRTLMAWVRTALALIGFGFAISQGYEYLESGYVVDTGKVLDTRRTPFYFGISFMVLGLLGTLAGIAQYLRVLKELRIVDPTYTEPWPFALVVTILLFLIGTLGILGVVL